ncbi:MULTISPECIES: hypothetical protein [Bacillus amyloliquefaciens group]|uniref:hypothetical protein n=1 Tax=Bacillus amyloliquefaciens group TaxID=1938374 RepID=UPI00073BD80C|nr:MULTISPECIES: hypothetical protein [Bacillus amyloliquefaciens group]KTF59115.1 hypothetical protein AR691_17685 [Bacillus amyloliquefaciens]
MFKKNKENKLTKREKLEKSGRKRKLDLGFLDSINLYTRLAADKLTRGGMDVPDRVLGDGQFYYSTNRIFTRRGVKKMFFIHDLPSEINRGFVTDLRSEIKREVHTYNETNGVVENASVTLVVNSDFYNLDFGDRRVQGRWSNFTRQYERVQKNAQNKKLEDELKSDKYSEAVVRKVRSFLYTKEAKEEQNASFFKTKVVLEIMATSDEVLEVAENALRGFCFRYKIKTKEVFVQTNEYQRSFTPAGSVKKSLLKQMNEGDVWADDTLASFTVTTHGVVGDTVGIYHGVDIQSRGIVAFDMGKGEDAKNVLLAAGSGEGKSNYVKMLYTFYAPVKVYATVAFDFEGREYIPLGRIFGAHVISMSGREGRYVNTVVIGDRTGDPDIDKYRKKEAMEATARVFHLLVDERYGMTAEQVAIFSDALNEVYADFGVTEDEETWSKSKDITYFHIYAKIREMRYGREKKYIEIHTQEILNNFIAILRPFFEMGGLYKHWFESPISIDEVMEARHVIFSFGMGGTDEKSVDSKGLALRQMFASYLTLLVASRNKARGVRTVVFLEELQRYLKQRYSGEIVANFSSGGRKLGMIVYYITNSPTALLMQAETQDDVILDNAATIMSNINMQIIGALSNSDTENLINYFGLENARGYLMELSKVHETNQKNADLKYCFLVRYKGQAAIVRMLSHPDLADLPLYKTLNNAGDKNDLRRVEHMDERGVEGGIMAATKKEDEMRKRDATFKERMQGSKVWS